MQSDPYHREAFEAAARAFYPYPFERDETGEYKEQLIYYVWRGWRMAIDHQNAVSKTPSKTPIETP